MKKIILFAICLLTSVTVMAQVEYEKLYVENSTTIDGLTYQYGIVYHENAPYTTYEATLTDGTTISEPTVDFIKSSFKPEGSSQLYTVTTIGDGAFSPLDNNSYSSIIHVVIPESITKIGANAFNNCSNMRFIEFLSPTIPTVVKNAFNGCSNLDFVYCKSNNANSSLPSSLPNNKMMTLYVPYESSSNYKDVNLENSWTSKFGNRIYGVDTENGGMKIVTCSDKTSDAYGMTFVCATGTDRQATIYLGKNKEEVVIPSYFNGDDNQQYKVVGIGRPGFSGFTNMKLQKLKIESELDYINSSAFSGCGELIYVGWCETDPNKYDPSIFPNNELMTLFVPNDSKSYYQGSKWAEKQFGDRIYGGEMKDVSYDNMDFIYADGYERETVLIKGKDGRLTVKSFSISGKDYNVKTIGKSAFDGKDVQSVTIGYGITTVSNMAFNGCSNLQTLKLPSTLKTIGSNAFNGCRSLPELSLPASLEKIGSGAFSGCDNLIRVENKSNSPISVPDNLFTINNYERILYFQGSLSSYQAIKGWKDGFTYFLNGTKINDKTTEYNDKQGNKICDITYATTDTSNDAIIMSVSNIVPQIFEVPATIGDKHVRGIYKDAFKQATSIEQLIIADNESAGNLTIGKEAFNGCSSLRLLKLPAHLDKLGSRAFSNCNNLAHILFKANASLLGTDVFSVNTLKSGTIYIPTNSTKDDFINKGWKPDNIEIANYLEEFKDPNTGMTYIGWKQNKTDKGTAKLTIGIQGPTDETLFVIGNTANSKEGEYAVIGIADNAFSKIGSFKNLQIDEDIVSIGENAFWGRTNLRRIILPQSITSIGNNAFYGCSNLTDIEPAPGQDQLKIEKIGSSAFYNCTSLEKITLPASLTSIGLSAFAGCSKLIEIESLIVSPFDIDKSVFANYSATLYVPSLEAKENYLNTNVWQDFGDKVSAGSRIVYPYKGLNYAYASEEHTAMLIKSNPEENNVEILSSFSTDKGDVFVTTIAESALKDKSKIVTLKIPEGVTKIGANAFENCSNLNKVELPKSLDVIGDHAFGKCGNIKTIISKIPADNLEKLNNNYKNVFTSDNAPTVMPSPEYIYIPVGEHSKETYTEKWNIFNEKLFVKGYPRYNEPDQKFGWYFDYLTTIDEGSVNEEDIATTLYGTATVIKAANRGETDGNLIIPEEVTFGGKKYQVTAIGDNAFNEYPEKGSVVKTLSFSENIKEIGKSAFSGFSSVQKIWLPKSLKLIKEWAFNGCSRITHVCSQMVNPQPMGDKLFPSIPTNNTATLFIPSEEGYNNDSWTKFSNIVEGEFKGDKIGEDGITYSCYIDVSKNLKAILTNSSNIKEALIKDYVSLGELKEGTNVDIYYNVTAIGKYAFQYCTQLETLELPSKLEAIGSQAFVNSLYIKTIVSLVPGGIVSSLNDNITNVFSTPSPATEKVYVPTEDAVKQYKEAWKDLFTTDNTKYIVGYPGYDGKGENGWLYDYITVDNKAIEETQNTATLKKAMQSAADENHVLPIPSEVTINEKKYKVTKIGDNAFNGYEGKNSDVELNIPETITEIGKNAFYGFSKLEKVRLSSSLKSIGSTAFAGCGNITHVCSEMDSPIMGDDVFSTPSPTATFFVPTLEGYNTNILDKFPNVVVGKFEGEKHDGELKYSCYIDADGNPKAILTKSGTSIDEALIKKSVKPSGEVDYTVTTIGKNAFKGCTKLKKLVLPSTLTSIGDVPPIGDNAFEDCGIDEIVSDIEGRDLKPIPTNVFSEYTRNNAKVYVLDDASKEVYQTTEGWIVFKSNDPDPEVERYIVGKWVDSEVQDDFMQYRYHTGIHDAIVIKIDFPNNEHKTLPIKREVRFDNDPVTYLVSTIAPTSITNKERIEYITIDNGISTIEADAFKGCINLKKVDFPSSLTTIGNNAFYGDSKLEKLRLEGVVTIGDNTFQGCTSLQKIWLPASLTSIGSKAFNGCNNLTRICIEAIPTMENTDAFSTYSKTLLFVPTGTLSTIEGKTGWSAFSRKYEGYYEDESPDGVDRAYIYLKQTDDKRTAILTKSLIADPISKTVVRGDYTYNVTIIGESAFNVNGVNLVNLDLPETITDIEKKAFQNQKNLTSITLPSNLKIIGNDAFSGNSKLESLTFSDKVESIGDNAFKGCSSLKKLVLPASLKTIGDGAFSGNTNLNDLTISEGIESIGDNTFKDCNSLQNIVLPSTLKTIGSTAFDGCDNLTEVISKIENKDVIESNSPSMPNAILYVQEATKGSYKGRWNCLHILEGDRKLSDNIGGLYYAYSTVDEEAILIDATSEAIDENKKVVIPGTINIKIGDDNKPYKVVAIDMSVFKGNTEIKSLVIEDNIEIIGANAFQGCSNLKMIELPASIKSIGEKAFDGCNSLIEVVCKSDDNDFVANNVLSLPNATLYVHEGTKSWYEGKWSYARIYEGERKIDEIGGLLYAYSPGADEAILVGIAETAEWTDGKVTIPGAISVGEPAKDYNVIDIADNVFKDNTAIKTIEIGENIQSIADNAFDGCANLKEVVSKIKNTSVISGIAFSLPNAILYVPDADLVEIYKSSWTFADYYVGNRLTTEIDGMSYVYATGDKKAILVNGIAEKLGEEILIKGSIIPEGETEEYTVIAVKENAFKGNTNIKTLKIEEKVKTIGANAFQGCSNLNKVWLPATLESIGEKAFDGCDIDYICTSSKTPLVSPNINNNVFSKYKATLYVPNGTLGSYSDSDVWKTFPIRRVGTFKGVKIVNNLTYECLTSGEGYTSENVAILAKSETTDKEVEVLSSVKLDGDDTTYKMTTISTVAFSGNNSRNLEKIIFPETLRKIEDKAFVQCTKLSVITSRIEKEDLTEFNENVFPQTIYDNATVYIPNDAETEAKYKATDGWKYFKNWAKGEKKTKPVGSMTYDYLVGVGTATLTGTSTSDEVVTIDGNITIDGVTYQVTAIGESAFNKNPNRGKMVKLIISENIKTIDANAFQGCNNLKKVWLPSTLTSIGAKAFDGCNAITHVSSKVDNPTLISENVFPTSATLFVPNGKKGDYSTAKFSYVAEGELVDDITEKGMTYDCLKGNKAILKKYTGSSNDVDIPSSVKIGNDSYTVAIIAKPAFTGKTNIESLVIPAGVGEIDAETFNACSKLKWIESKIENPISISSNVFANYTATLFIPKNNVTEYENKGWKFLNIYVGERKETTISDGCTYVYSTGDKKAILIKTATNDKEVTVNGTFKIGKDEYTVTAIAESVFKGKTKMETLKISENIKNIGAYAFQGCTNLQKIEFPATLKKIGSNAFDGCTSLVSVTCEGKEPAEIGAGAFPSYNITVNVPKEAVDTYKGDTYWREFTTILGITTTVTDDPTGPYNITAEAESGATPTVELWNGMDASGEYVIPEKVEIDGSDYMVTAIAAGAFEDNTNLTNITIPSSVSSIGTSAFAGCSNLKSITVKWENPLQLSVAGARGMTRSGGSSIFDGVNKNTCILYVPAGCVDKYKAAAVWKEFKNILEIGTTAINGVVISEDGKPFDIYNMQGRKVRDNVTSFDGLPSGVYIVNGKKVMVK